MPKGGRQPGAGRPKGAVNKEKREVAEILAQHGGIEARIKKLIELGDGVKCAKYIGEKEIIYDKPPDSYANSFLIEQVCGKAKQKVELNATVRTIEDELFDLEGEDKVIEGESEVIH